MKLYIDNQEVYFDKDFDVNMTFKFLDTYNPSAVKSSYSKTVSIPDCIENARIFSNLKARYSFELYQDDGGSLLEKGYCTLDKVKTTELVKTYDITLYGGLGDFFYNLKGDDDNPKTLASLYWGHVTGKSKAREELDPIMTWNNQYVYNTWFTPSENSIWDTFRAVPCIYDDKILKKNLTIVPAEDGLFPRTGSTEGSRPFVGSDLSEALLVESDENTCYAKQDFRSDLMPLGIKYKSIIEAICNPENNGGYTVDLDPDFFKESNPYWTNTFLLKGLPTLDYEYAVNSASLNDFSCSLVRVGNYEAGGSTSGTSTLRPRTSVIPWTITGGGSDLSVESGYEIYENCINYDLSVFIRVPSNSIPGSGIGVEKAWVQPIGNLTIALKCTNLDTSTTITLATRTYTSRDAFDLVNVSPYNIFTGDSFKGVASFPTSWKHIRLEVELGNSKPGSGVKLIWRTPVGGNVFTVNGDFCGPGYSGLYTGVADSTLALTSDYSSNSAVFEDLKFTKKDLLSGTKTPFDYLIWYTKMFNLRFHLDSTRKKVSIYLPENLVSLLDPEDIDDRITYSREYSLTKKIIDEGFLKFNLTPNKNDTTEKYQEAYGDNLFDGTYAIPGSEIKGEKEYLNSGLKIGSKARNVSAFSVRTTLEGYTYFGFNQATSYGVTYVSGSGTEESRPSDNYSLNYQEGKQRYDFLNLGDGLQDTIVMYSGLKDLPWPTQSAIISRTSVDMVRCAGAPCWIGGWVPRDQGLHSSLLGADCIHVRQIPHYGIVPSNTNYDWGLTYKNVDYESIIATGNIYDKYLRTFLNRVYSSPLVVECYVRLVNPDFRKLYWFNNNYWILTEVSNYNYRDEPVKCKFIRYRYDA